MPGSERPGAKGGKGGRPYTWEDGYALRHPGAFKAEPVDEDGLFKEEHDANVKAQETFQKFAPKGAGAADRAIADLGLAQTQQQKVCGTARRLAQASHEQHKVIADEYTAAMAPLPLVTSAVGTFFEDAFFGAGGGLTKAIADALAEADAAIRWIVEREAGLAISEDGRGLALRAAAYPREIQRRLLAEVCNQD